MSRHDKRNRICAVPGCSERIANRSASGMCSQHMHDPIHCQCVRCQYLRASAHEDKTKDIHPQLAIVVAPPFEQTQRIRLTEDPFRPLTKKVLQDGGYLQDSGITTNW